MLYYEAPTSSVSATIVMSLLDTAAIALRVIARKWQHQPLLADNWLIFPALLVDTLLISADHTDKTE